ncbi:MAG: hypothetical protein QHH02_05005 [Syntrophomonadaceae bacterium]|nr:hypothetical protein [Syntrophomonadaceae bacterium]
MAVLIGPGSDGAASLFYALQLGSGARLSKQVPPGGRRTVRGDTAAVRLDRFCRSGLELAGNCSRGGTRV